MKHFSAKLLPALCCGLALSACGGGGEGGGGVMGVQASSLIGVNAETGADPRAVSLIETTGATDGQNGVSADFAGYTFAASKGFENGSAVEDGNTIGLLTEIDLPTQTDIRVFDGAYNPGSGVRAIYYGIAGAAPESALPTTNSATWTGNGFANLVSDTGRENLGIGAASVTADFGGSVSAQITGLSGSVDSITLNDLAISGNRFAGASVATAKSGSSVNVVGANATADVAGIFSGTQDAAGIPDEVGALFHLNGDSATLIGGFVAD